MNFIKALSLIEFNASQAQASIQVRTHLYGLDPYQPNYRAGNCLFVGAAEFLDEYNTMDLSDPNVGGAALRAEIVEFIRRDPNLCDRIEALAGVETNTLRTSSMTGEAQERHYNSVDEYLGIMAEDQTWAAELEVAAIARQFQRPVVLFTPGNVFDCIYEEPAFSENEPIFLDYVNNNHYRPLARPESIDRGREIVAQVRQNIAARTAGNNNDQAGEEIGDAEAEQIAHALALSRAEIMEDGDRQDNHEAKDYIAHTGS